MGRVFALDVGMMKVALPDGQKLWVNQDTSSIRPMTSEEAKALKKEERKTMSCCMMVVFAPIILIVWPCYICGCMDGGVDSIFETCECCCDCCEELMTCECCC